MAEASRSVAIVGGSGFIGHSVATNLHNAGHKVTILDIATPPDNPGWDHVEFDLRDESWPHLVSKHFDVLIVAAGVLAKGCNENPDHAWDINVTSTQRLLAALVVHHPGRAVVFLSSGMVYDLARSTSPLTEDAATRGVCVYTRSKLEVEATLASYASRGLLTALILRPFTVYGQGALAGDRGHLFGRWLELGRTGQNLTIYGDGTQPLDAVRVERIGEAVLGYLRQDSPPQQAIVNITSGRYVTLKRLAELFVEAGLAPGIDFMPAPESDGIRGWGDATAFKNLVGESELRSPQDEIAEFLAAVGPGRLVGP